MLETLPSAKRLFVKQVFEMAEIFGFESRNKYRICNEAGADIGFAAEQQKGFFGMLFRQFLGHWRSFSLHFFDAQRRSVMMAERPFRWYFQRLEVRFADGRPVGVIERYFAIFSKRFKVEDARGRVLLEVSSPFWRVWTFPFLRNGREAARVSKKWSGFGSELFTDRDNFLIEYLEPSLGVDERALVLAAAVYIDLMFFERKGSGVGFNLLDLVSD